jgi:NAD-dependent SIR2 family protein deacetylase
VDDPIDRASAAIAAADALLISAGAGMGVDSGLPDFRGDDGFWRAYPPLRELGLSFVDMANPRWFRSDPELAWGFYGHRLALYRKTRPHEGFRVLARLAAEKRSGAFVFTSNVDGAFQRAGFLAERVVECHGAIDFCQCTRGCGAQIFGSPEAPDVDEATFRARAPLPSCPRCSGLARPNILLFGDFEWDGARTEAQESRFEAWLADLRRERASLAVIEIGAGTAIPTVRMLGERLVVRMGATLIRINLREADVPADQIGISSGAEAALLAIERRR